MGKKQAERVKCNFVHRLGPMEPSTSKTRPTAECQKKASLLGSAGISGTSAVALQRGTGLMLALFRKENLFRRHKPAYEIESN